MSHRAPSYTGCFWWHKNNNASPNTPQLAIKPYPTHTDRRPPHTLKSDRCLVFSAGRPKKPCVFQSFYGLPLLFQSTLWCLRRLNGPWARRESIVRDVYFAVFRYQYTSAHFLFFPQDYERVKSRRGTEGMGEWPWVPRARFKAAF